MDLHDRVALITGATGGLGSFTARMLAAEGAHLAVTHLGHRDEGIEVCHQVEAQGRKSFLTYLDQADPASCDAAVAATVRALSRLDTLINNAAWNDPVPFSDLDGLTPEIWDRSLNTNLRGPFLMSRATAPCLKQQDQGRIVNIAGVPGPVPTGSTALAVSKTGLIHLTRCLAVALAPSITVNCVVPGLMEGTRMFAHVPPEGVAAMKEKALLKRATNPEDVCQQVLLFCQSRFDHRSNTGDRSRNRFSLITASRIGWPFTNHCSSSQLQTRLNYWLHVNLSCRCPPIRTCFG